MSEFSHAAWFFILCFATIISGIFILTEGLKYSNSIESENGYCSINNVAYTRDIHDKKNMVSCKCGKRCVSEEGTTMTVYGTFYTHDDEKISSGKILSNVNYHRGGNTYQETRCHSTTRSDALRSVYNKAKPFIQKKNTTKTIDCYYFQDRIYLYNDYDLNIFIASCVFGSLCVLCWLIYCCCRFIKKKRNKSIDV